MFRIQFLKTAGILSPCDSVILLFVCELASDEAGKEFVQKLADWSGATVFANTQLTGDGEEGSGTNWSLDVVKRPSDYLECPTKKSQPVRAVDTSSFMFPGGLIVDIPGGALTSNGSIQVTDVTDYAKIQMVDTDNLYQAWDISFRETDINNQALVTVKMPLALGLDIDLSNIDPSRITVKYWNVYTNSWSDMGITDVEVNDPFDYISFKTSHATIFGVFVAPADVTPPSISVTVTPNILWPPNHKMALVTPTITVSDDSDHSPVVKLISITMNEGDRVNTYDPNFDTTLTAGKTGGDIQVDQNGNVYLRAERSASGSGRIYTLTYQAIDKSGNSRTATAAVLVPHNM
jgi:hypothetical protein